MAVRSVARSNFVTMLLGGLFAVVPPDLAPAQSADDSPARGALSGSLPSDPDFDPSFIMKIGADQTEPLRAGEAPIYYSRGFSYAYLVSTGSGNVVIDTGIAFHAPRHKKILSQVNDQPVEYIVLTHAHADHTGGVRLFKGPETEVIAQENHEEFVHYQTRLAGTFARRNAAQFNLRIPLPDPNPGNYAAAVPATILFDEEHEFTLGNLTFRLLHTPGETYDHLTVWIPELKAAFVGDNFYDSFPNLYTLRGTKPRFALDYVESINRVLALEPEILLPSHGDPILGAEEVKSALTKYRDAILYVHDATVAGLNEGKDVYTLMQEIKLPPELDVGEGYGAVAWSVRGIADGYLGWFDENPATMFSVAPSAIHPELIDLAGGPDAVATRARKLLDEDRPVEALYLTDVALAADPSHEPTLTVRIEALELLLSRSANLNEYGWLQHGLREARASLKNPTPAE